MSTPDPAVQVISDVTQGVATGIKDVNTKNTLGLATDAVQTGTAVLAVIPAALAEVKEGYKTSEFWGVVAAGLNAALTTEGWVPKVVSGALAVLYAFARSYAKGSAKHAAANAVAWSK